MWASDDGTGKNQPEKDNHKEITFLEVNLVDLRDVSIVLRSFGTTKLLTQYAQQLDNGIQETLKDFRSAVDENIIDEFEKAQKNASDLAVPVAQNWGAHGSDGGMVWARCIKPHLPSMYCANILA